MSFAKKQIHLEPYLPLFYRPDMELERKSKWVVIGYSFGEPTVRDVFVMNGNPTKRLVSVSYKQKK
jgi:hypothetical protein